MNKINNKIVLPASVDIATVTKVDTGDSDMRIMYCLNPMCAIRTKSLGGTPRIEVCVSDQTAKFISTVCKCGFKNDIAAPLKCPSCKNGRFLRHQHDSGVDEIEKLDSAKASLVEFEVDEITDIHTLDPDDGFSTTGIDYYGTRHDEKFVLSGYQHLLNVGNTPHMQKKIYTDELVNIINNSRIAVVKNFMSNDSYGSARVNKTIRDSCGVVPEQLNMGNRKLSDNQLLKIKNDISWITYVIDTSEGNMSEEEFDELSEKQARLLSVLKTGNMSCGYQGKEFDINNIDRETDHTAKVLMERDIGFNDSMIDIESCYSKIKKAKSKKTRKTKAVKTKSKKTRKTKAVKTKSVKKKKNI